MNRLGFAALVLLVAACAGPAATASPVPTPVPTPSPTMAPSPTAALETLNGTLKLTASIEDLNFDAGCAGENGYEDIYPGAQVIVKNESGDILGEGHLVFVDYDFTACTFSFRVQGIPVAKFYTVTVGSRDPLTYSYDELKGQGWSVSLSLGS
jgi:hypothetical protein